MILYHGEPSGPSLAVLAAMEECGLEVDCRRIDLLAGERHRLPGISDSLALDMSVEGEGPVLVIGGEAMTESVFLAQFFDEQAGGNLIQPADPYRRWQMMMWCRQVTERLSPAVALLGNLEWSQAALAALPSKDYARLAGAIASSDLRERWHLLRSGPVPPAAIEDSAAKIDHFAERIEGQLARGGDWLIGSFSIADLETYAWMASALELRPQAASGKPALGAWLKRMAARPSVRRAIDRATVAEPLHSFAPGPEINRWG